ncbi:PhzF family phenazine biosynthesis protein [Thiohalobacter sp. COW1]|uniref:PhzF family phenazine biosynthesis protein n=1 Tax=Thiohalobacter sp. COW1 TaxID=2795687 RepID=UPI001F5B6FB9
MGIPEDPVTGSAYCKPAPYGAGKPGKTQCSPARYPGVLPAFHAKARTTRVVLDGSAVMFMQAEIAFDA